MKKTDDIYLNSLDGFEFEELCKIIFERLDYGRVKKTPSVGDLGKDLIIHNDGKKIFVECKHHFNRTIGRPVIQKLHSAVISEEAVKGIVITTGHFSKGAINYAKNTNPPIELIDKNLLFDMASRAELKLQTEIGKGSVYTFSISSDEDLKNNLSEHIDSKLISKPTNICECLSIKKRKISLNPMYKVSYSIDVDFETTVGVVSSVHDNGIFFIDGDTGGILSDEISYHFLNASYNNLQSEKTDKAKIKSFKFLSNKVKNIASNYIIGKHTHKVSYSGRNRRVYTKECIPKKKHIFISDITQVYIPDNDISFNLMERNRFFKIADNGTSDFFTYKENISNCEICGKAIKGQGILCNDCGKVTHNKKFFNFMSHGFFCKRCGKSICKDCTYYFRKFLFLKLILCKECAQKEEKKTIKKFRKGV